MRRIHIALAVDNLEQTIQDYTERLGAPPTAVLGGRYALWRTPEVNLSVNSELGSAPRLRHLGFEDDGVVGHTESTDVNGLLWEAFHPDWQIDALAEVYGAPESR